MQIYRSYISPNQKIWSQMLSINRQKFANLPNQNILAKRIQNSPEFRNLAINSPIWQPCRVLFAIERSAEGDQRPGDVITPPTFCYSVSLWRGELSEVARNCYVFRDLQRAATPATLSRGKASLEKM